MSGGSFNYLYSKEISEDTYGYLEDSKRMLSSIERDYDSKERRFTAHTLKRVIKLVMLSKDLLEEAQHMHESISGPLHAVEWHHSADYGKEQVEEAFRDAHHD